MDQHSCYYCKKNIDEKDLVLKSISQLKHNAKTTYREFHYYCAPKMVESLADDDIRAFEDYWFKKCYGLFCKIYDLEAGRSLDSYTINRIRGMRVGKTSAKGHNTVGIKGGYGYDVIYNTAIYVMDNIKYALRSVDFKNDIGRSNYIFKIIEGSIGIVQTKMNKKRREMIMQDTIELYSDNSENQYDFNKTQDERDKLREIVQEHTHKEDDKDIEQLFSSL